MFDQSTITEVFPPVVQGGQLWISWTSSSPSGTWFQVYLDRVLAWWGTATHVALTLPGGPIRVDIGTVLPGEQQTDFSALLPVAPYDRAVLSWLGGTYEDPTGNDDIAGFRVYGEPSPGAGINYTTPLADVTAYINRLITDGYGQGGYGQGGYGRSAGSYSWESDPLANGLWAFAVAPYDHAGNVGTGSLAYALIQCPPAPPARNAAGVRLTYTYSPISQKISLAWLASPG
jgi:hypothetical protein